MYAEGKGRGYKKVGISEKKPTRLLLMISTPAQDDGPPVTQSSVV